MSKNVQWSLKLSRDKWPKTCQLLEGRGYLIFYFGFYISVALYQATRSYKYKLIKSSKQPYEVSTILFLPGSLVSVFITLLGSLPWRQTDLSVCVPVHFLFLMQNRHHAHICGVKAVWWQKQESASGAETGTTRQIVSFCFFEQEPISTSAGPKPASQIKKVSMERIGSGSEIAHVFVILFSWDV